MTQPIERIKTALEGRGYVLREYGAGWTCRCPAHDDTNPSLSIAEGDDGRVLLHCFAGCSLKRVCEEIGLQPRDLFPASPRDATGRFTAGQRPEAAPRSKRESGRRRTKQRNIVTFSLSAEVLDLLERRHGRPDMTWPYTNSTGEPAGYVLRWNTPAGKRMTPVSRMPDGRWANVGMPCPRPLYALPELLATKPGDRIYITEGEKAADAARALGLIATTSPHGANSAAKADWSPLRNREVAILVDHDSAGEEYGEQVTGLAFAAGARSVKVVRLAKLWPGMPEAGDIADLLHNRGGDVSLRAEIESLVQRTPEEMTKPDSAVPLKFQPFPVNVLPEAIREFVVDGATSIGCDTSFITLPLLAGLAAAIGNTHRIKLKQGWTEPPIVWTVIVGESGTQKTPGFRLAMKPIQNRQSQAFKMHAAAMEEWKADKQLYEVRLKAWQRGEMKAKGDACALPPPAEPLQPTANRYLISDTTTEAVAPILLTNPRGLLLYRDELNGWLGSFDRYAASGKGADSSHWLSMHTGEAMTIDRKTSNPPTIHVPSASVCITGGIQPGILAAAMSVEHHESGMLARMLFAEPPRRAKKWTEATINPETEAAVEAIFDRLYSLESTVDAQGDSCPHCVSMSPEAKAVWIEFYNEHNREQRDLTGDEAAAWSKLEAYAARFALIMHLIRWAAQDPAVPTPTSSIDKASVDAGIALVRWFGNETQRVYAQLSETGEERAHRELKELVRARGGDISASELSACSRKYRPSDVAEEALDRLVNAGDGVWVQPTQDGVGAPRARRFMLAAESSTGVNETLVGDTPTRDSVDIDTTADTPEALPI